MPRFCGATAAAKHFDAGQYSARPQVNAAEARQMRGGSGVVADAQDLPFRYAAIFGASGHGALAEASWRFAFRSSAFSASMAASLRATAAS